MESEADPARVDDRGLQLRDIFVRKSRGVGHDANGTAGGGREAFVVIQRKQQMEGVLGHG